MGKCIYQFRTRSKATPCPFVRPYEKKITAKTIKFSLLALPFMLTPNTFAQTQSELIYTETFSFTLTDIEFNESASIYGNAFTSTLVSQFKGQKVNLKDLQSIENQITAFYAQALNLKNIQVIVQLPQKGDGVVKVNINEPTASAPQSPAQAPRVEAVAFSGSITLDANSVLSIANAYTQKPYSLVNSLNLRKELKTLYSENNISATISIPEFDQTTGDLYIHIEEGIVQEYTDTSPAETLPAQEKNQKEKAEVVQPIQQPKQYEVSKNLFLLKPAPKNWKEPKWLTQPAKSKTSAKKKPQPKAQPKAKATEKTDKTTKPQNVVAVTTAVVTPTTLQSQENSTTPVKSTLQLNEDKSSAYGISKPRTTHEINLIYSEPRLAELSSKVSPIQAFAQRRNIWGTLKDKNLHVQNNTNNANAHFYGALKIGAKKDTNNEITNNANLNIQGSANVMNMTGHINANITKSNQEDLQVEEVKANLTQVDSEGNLLGFMNAKQFELGDIHFQTQPLLNTKSKGRGLMVTNKSVNTIRDPDNFKLTGNAPAGWDVEVYQNNFILDFQTVDTNGEYNFTALPLKLGENNFTIKVYGPNGEKREYTETYVLDSGKIKQGAFYYDIIATESSNSLYKNEEASNDDGLASLSMEYGLLNNFSVLTGAFAGDLYGEEQTAYTAGVRTKFLNTDIQADYIAQSDEATAYQLSLRRHLGKTADISINYKMYDGYLQKNNPIKSSYGVVANKEFAFEDAPSIHTQLAVNQQELLTGNNQTVFQNQIGTKLANFHITNALSATISDHIDNTYTGAFAVSYKPSSRYNVRAKTNYRISEETTKINQLTLGLNAHLNKTTTMRGDLTQTFDKGIDKTTLNSEVSWHLDNLNLGFNLGGDNQGNMNAGINLSTHLLPEDDSYSFNSSGIIQQNNVNTTLRAFLDANNNNQYDAGEKTLKDVVFKHKKQGYTARTNKDGLATLKGLKPHGEHIISVDLLSVRDIYIKPVHENINVANTSFQQSYIDFPMQYLGEVTGRIEYFENEMRRPMNGITMTLKNSKGEIVAESMSELDGYYTFTQVPTGTYTLMPLLPSELMKNTQPIQPLQVNINQKTLNLKVPNLQIYARIKTAEQLMDDAILNMQNEVSGTTP